MILAQFVDVTATNSFIVIRPGRDAMGPEHRHPVFKPPRPVRDLGKVADAIAFLLGREGAVVSCDDLQRASGQTGPKAVLMLLVAERRGHHAARCVVPIFVEILALIQRQVLDQRLAVDPLAILQRAADGFVAFLATRMDDIKRHARHVSDHDRAVGRLTLDLRGARIGVAFGAIVPLRQQFRSHVGDDVAVFGMDHGHGAQFGAAVEGREQLIIVHHQRAFVGEEVLERGDALVLHDGFHVVKDLLPPPGDRHVEGIVAMRNGRFVVPAVERGEERFFGVRQGEIHHHRGAASEGGAGA